MNDKIQIAHGSGGRLSSQLIEQEIVTRFGNGPLKNLPDAATLPSISGKLVFSTDSYVVHPYEFPGGDIGNLAIHGTVNDISVAGGEPKWISLGLILEEGLPIKAFRKILDSIKRSADECNVQIVTGDTKVVSKGQCDSIYINTAGIGESIEGFDLDKNRIEKGDCIIISGNIGDHGMAVLSARENLGIENGPLSDTGSVHRLIQNIQEFATDIKFMRDPTRGGIAAVLNEIVTGTNIGAIIDSCRIPVAPETNSISEIMGIDILNVACEGRALLICKESVSEAILAEWKKLSEGKNAAIIGKINQDACRVTLQTITGGTRLIDVPSGEILPRIC